MGPGHLQPVLASPGLILPTTVALWGWWIVPQSTLRSIFVTLNRAGQSSTHYNVSFFFSFYITDLIVKTFKFLRSNPISPPHTKSWLWLGPGWHRRPTDTFVRVSWTIWNLKINNPWIHHGIWKNAFCKKRKENPSDMGILSKWVKYERLEAQFGSWFNFALLCV